MKNTIILIAMLCSLNANGNENIRYEVATLTSCNFYAEESTTIGCFTDNKGNDWIMYGVEAPIGSKCIIEYDSKGTDDIYDDEITNVIYLSNTREIVDARELSAEELESRNGKLIIERTIGIVYDDKGNGHVIGMEEEFYINYSHVDGVDKGDVVCTYLFYNPHTSYTDDITARYDIVMK